MKRVACGGTVLITVPPCAEPPTEAVLTRRPYPAVPLELTPAVAGVLTFTIPDDARRGVHELTLRTSCGCYYLPLFIDTCPAPAAVSTHEGIPAETPECCTPQGEGT